jgi:hypothetical protein
MPQVAVARRLAAFLFSPAASARCRRRSGAAALGNARERRCRKAESAARPIPPVRPCRRSVRPPTDCECFARSAGARDLVARAFRRHRDAVSWAGRGAARRTARSAGRGIGGGGQGCGGWSFYHLAWIDGPSGGGVSSWRFPCGHPPADRTGRGIPLPIPPGSPRRYRRKRPEAFPTATRRRVGTAGSRTRHTNHQWRRQS